MKNHARTIVFVESVAAMGGVQFSTLYLAQALDRARWNPIVVCPAEGDLTRLCREQRIEVRIVAQPRMLSTSVRVGANLRLPNPFAWAWNALAIKRAAGRLKDFLRQCSPDLVVTKGLSTHFIGGVAARKLRIPCIWHVQDLISERTVGIYRRVFALAAQRLPAHIIVDGAAISEQLPSSLESRVSVVHNGVDTSVFRPDIDGSYVREELDIPRDAVVIGHAGRITPWKGQHYLIEAFARLAGQHPNLVLMFAGAPVFDHSGYEQRLRKMAAEHGLESRVAFAGYRHDLPSVLAAMDIFAFTSIEKDTSPLALLSAFSSGLPIVAFDIEGVRELIDKDDQLLRVPVDDSPQLAETLTRLIADTELRVRMGRAVRELADRKYSLTSYVGGMEAVLSKIARSNLTTEVTENYEDHTMNISPTASVVQS
jgi:glycosyltransferase involved in cell wall biosynthesis